MGSQKGKKKSKRKNTKMERMNKMIDPQCYKTSCARYEGISLKLKKINNEACNSDVYLHCEEGKSSSGESS